MTRDISEPDPLGATATPTSAGRNVIVVIGIDNYEHWPQLANAVHDAMGISELFQRLGFELAMEPLLNTYATSKAIQSLVTDDLSSLGSDDSLVLFYAGHGGTRKHYLGDKMIKTGYLIPVEASVSPDKVATWIDLEGWLRAVSLLPARHILVVLDACHSGIALDPIVKWRDFSSCQDLPLPMLRVRRSRRIITSALDDQIALDSGPVHGHSLFTGCLIEGITGGIPRDGHRMTTGSELGLYVQRRVQTYPHSRQTPDFGAFGFDDRGEMVIPLMVELARTDDKLDPGPTAIVPVLSSATLAQSDAIPGQPTPLSKEAPAWTLLRLLNRRRSMGVTAIALTISVIVVRMTMRNDSPTAASARVADLISSKIVSYDTDANIATESILDVQSPSGEYRIIGRGCLSDMVPIPTSTFLMGSPDGIGDADEHPVHEVKLSAYCIDRTEVAIKSYVACVAARGCSAMFLTPTKSEYSAADPKFYGQFCNREDRPDHPINCVDWNQATAYCAWIGKRLPTEAEWEYAARGNDGRLYPWGNESPSAQRVNGCGAECAAMGMRILKRDWKTMYDTSDGWETTAPVGTFVRGASPFGALDMAGNVWEWTADWYGPYTEASAINPRGPLVGSFRVDRGGGWHSPAAGYVRTAVRDWNDPASRRTYVGFRCARAN
jgi:formylglycine-generating enzyme required for sulfatase activity/uncharacterized caspase-like protein